MLTVKVLGGSAHLLKRKNLFALLGVNTTLYYVRHFLLLTLYVRLYYVETSTAHLFHPLEKMV